MRSFFQRSVQLQDYPNHDYYSDNTFQLDSSAINFGACLVDWLRDEESRADQNYKLGLHGAVFQHWIPSYACQCQYD